MVNDQQLSLRINGADCHLTVQADVLLLDLLRYECGLTGAKLGCGTGDCGTCTVLLDDEAVNACLVYALECEGRSVITVEGAVEERVGAVVAEELLNADAVQCGFCTPGLVMSTCALLARSPGRVLVEEEIKEALAGNLCRCTGYVPIVRAVQRASEILR